MGVLGWGNGWAIQLQEIGERGRELHGERKYYSKKRSDIINGQSAYLS